MILQRLKAFALVFLLGTILSGAAGTFVYFKLKAETSAQIKLLQSQIDQQSDTVDVLSESFVRREELRQELDARGRKFEEEVKHEAQKSPEVRTYLASPTPEPVIGLYQRAYCLSMPGECVYSGDKTPSKP